ncbi:MAG: oligosaccharide flippase family protein [Pegethrix bostrychoides GSE-TBD4-15B]|jgi:O-antigen/teichoic acid export membrane protein|uniref:Oligosaccharide flippase family protein n=1 Tax=Pegethrix bostrychoides GSE-TBD4-15B TaxID=2839662 RepID=A0A951U7A2_9CYAN|nr:oligosaccharide flippase family protein [Pegethrix bostrychoides GSE-TBD4-15B]
MAIKFVQSRLSWVLQGQSSTAAAVQTLLARVLILAVNLATGIITARTLGATGRGEQAAMILWSMFLANTVTLGLPSAVIYNFKAHPQRKSELFAAALLLGTGLGFVASAIGIIWIPLWLSQYSPDVVRAAQWFMLNAPIALVQLLILAALEAMGDFTASNRLRLLIPLITLVALISLAVADAITPLTSSLAYTLNGLPIFFWTLTRLWRLLRPQWQGITSAAQQLVHYGLRSYGVDLLGALSLQLDQVLVVSFLDPASMGTYVVALSLSRMLNVFQMAIAAVLFPRAAARPMSEVIALTGQAARLTTALTFTVGLAIIALGPFLLELLYGAEFVQAARVLYILVIEAVISGAALVLAQSFMALGNPGVVTVLQGAGLALSVPLMIWLIPIFGLVGAGLALLASTVVRLLFTLSCYPLLLKVPLPALLITKQDLIFLRQKLLN